MQGKSTAFSEFRGDGDFTAVKKSQMLHYGKPQTGASHVSRAGAVDTIKPLEEPLEVLGGNAVAVVVDKDLVARS